MIRSHFSSVMSKKALNPGIPALLTRTSRRSHLGPDPLDRRVHLGPVGHVDTAEGEPVEPEVGELVGHRPGRLLVQVQDDDGESVVAQADGDGPPDARAGPGHDGNPDSGPTDVVGASHPPFDQGSARLPLGARRRPWPVGRSSYED